MILKEQLIIVFIENSGNFKPFDKSNQAFLLLKKARIILERAKEKRILARSLRSSNLQTEKVLHFKQSGPSWRNTSELDDARFFEMSDWR
jgi:hypothetical protein